MDTGKARKRTILATTRKRAITQKCHDCMGQYRDGRRDCEVTRCPLYTYMPYRRLPPDTSWLAINPRRVGEQPAPHAPESTEAVVVEQQTDVVEVP